MSAQGLNIIQFNQSISRLLQGIAEGIPNIVQTIALDAKALVRNRVQEKGLNAEEQELAGYSPEYQKRKKKAGKDVGFTNLTFTGDMWRKVDVVSAQQQGSKYEVLVGGKDQLSENKLEWNSARYGDVLDVSTKEEELMTQTYDEEIQKIIDQNGFGQ